MHIERLEDRTLLSANFGSLPEFRNPMQQFDVNSDGRISPLDALVVINELNNTGPRQLITQSGGVQPIAVAGEPSRFIDTNGDGKLTALDALMVINKLNAAAGEQVSIRVEVTDLTGTPVDTLSPGQDFQLRGYTQDLRLPADDPQRGVFSVYWDVNYDATRVALDFNDRMVEYDPPYLNGHRSLAQFSNTPGLFDDIGAVAGLNPHGSLEELVLIIPMTATGPGVAFFSLDPADDPLFPVAVYGGGQVPDNEILFIADSVTIGAQPSATIANLSLPEGNVQNDAVLTVTLSNPAIVPSTIQFTTMADTGANPATAGTDYVATSGVVNFAVGETTKTISVPILGDLLQEPDETFKVVLSAPTGVTIADGEAIVTIVNDDSPPVMTINNVSVVEPVAGSTNAVFTVTLSNPVNQNVTVNFATVSASAMSPDDFTTTSGTLTFAPGQTTQTISVPILADNVVEGTENYIVALSGPVGAQFPGGAATISGTGTITDPAAAKVIIRLESRNAQGDLQTVFQPGDEIRIRAYLRDASAGDPDNQDGVFQAFHDLVYDTTLVDVANRPITFGPDYLNQQTGDLTMDGLVDEIGASDGFTPLGAGETFFWEIAFTAEAQGLARFTSNPADLPEHEVLIFGSNVAVDPSEVQYGSVDVLIGQGPSISISDAQVTEGNSGTTPMNFQVSLSSAHLLPVTVSFATSNGTAIAPADYQAATGTVTFTPGETVKTITVNVVGDTELESAENFFVTLSNPINATIAEGGNRATGTILDDEVRSLSINDRSIAEGAAGVFTVSLSSPAASNISVNFATADGTATAGLDYLPASGTLTFAPGEQTKTITVQTLTDAIAANGETFLVQLSGAAGANIARATGVGTISEVPLAGLSGSVYVDSNGDGQKGISEVGLAGVTIELIGVATLPGGGTQQVQLMTQTDAAGRYLFENLPSGSYSIHEIQPAFFNDGIDTAGPGGVVTANDWMFINFSEGGTAAGFNFGEVGLRIQFMGKRTFLASAINGTPTMDLSGGDAFIAFDAGFNSLDVQALSNTGQAATITILDNNLNVLARSAVSQAASLSFAGNPGQPYFLRIGGGSSSVTVNSFVLGGPNASGQTLSSAGEDLFAGTDDWLGG